MVIRFQHIAALIIVLVVGTLGCAPRSAAETAYQSPAGKETEKLKQLGWSLDATQKKLAALQITLQEDQQSLAAAQQKHAPSQEHYFQAKRRLQSLKNRAGSNPSLEQMSALKNEELKFILIESKHEDINEDLLAKQEALASTQQTLAETNQKIAKLNRQINQQHKLIEKANRLAFQKKERQLQEKEQQMIQQAKVDSEEIARLRTLLAEKEQALADALADAAHAKAKLASLQQASSEKSQPVPGAAIPQPKVIAVVKPKPTATKSRSRERQRSAAREKPASQLAKNSSARTRPISQKPARFELIDDRKAAKQAMLAFTHAAGASDKTSKKQSDRLIKVRRSTASASGSSKILEAHGNFQYRGKLRLKGGKYELKVGDFAQQAVLPASERTSTYIVLFDNRPQHGPRLSLLERKLLD